MALDFAMSGGNFIFSNINAAGIWGFTQNFTISSAAPASGTEDSFAFQSGLGTSQLRTPNLGSFSTIIAGVRLYQTTLTAITLIQFLDATAVEQCSLRINATGQYFFSRNGTTIGSASTLPFVAGVWTYIEFKAILSTGGAGTCEVRVNGVTILTSTALTNATTTAVAAAAQWTSTVVTGGAFYKDFYVVDTASGANTTYLGDVRVQEIFDNGPGYNSAWTTNVGPFTLTSVNASNVYFGTITGGAANAYVGYNFNVTGFGHAVDNVTGASCTASNATALTLSVTGGTTAETNTASAAFQCPVQIGINQTGTRPNGDVVYVFSNTANQVIDFVHQTYNLPGIILAIAHLSNARKDDTGTRIFQQYSNSSGTITTTPNISPGNSYQYWINILENDPNTGTQWSSSGFNAAVFGVKEIT